MKLEKTVWFTPQKTVPDIVYAGDRKVYAGVRIVYAKDRIFYARTVYFTFQDRIIYNLLVNFN